MDLEKLEYKGESSDNKWVDAPEGFDRKAMKWDVGYIPREGKIDINAESEKRLEIATAFMWEDMKLSHLDGYSMNKHSLAGEYLITLRVNGKVFVGQDKKEIEPIIYKIKFKYQRLYLKLLEIKKCGSSKATI